MATLSVRRLDEDVYERLRARAAQHGVSMEEEARRILQKAVSAPDQLGQLAIQCFGEAWGVELDLPARTPHPPLDLGE